MMRELDSLSCPLDGVHLVEAAAGTGKTYNIQNLAVRMILERGIPIEKLLVVTYTKSATRELRERIRKILKSTADYLAEGVFDRPDSREHGLLRNASGDFSAEGLARCGELLRRAALAFDDNAVCTIHGFCQNMLTRNAFESGILFDVELNADPSDLIRKIIENRWRRIVYAGDSPDRIPVLEAAGLTLRAILGKGDRNPKRPRQKSLREKITELPGLVERAEVRFEGRDTPPPETLIRDILDSAAAIDPEKAGEAIGKLAPLMKSSLGKKQEESLRTALGRGRADGEFLRAASLFLPESFEKCLSSVVSKAENAKTLLAEDPVLREIARIAKCMETLHTAVLNDIRDGASAEFETLKRTGNFQTYSDLLTRMHEKIMHEPSPLLEAVRAQFDAAVIDEFQDTDRVQYDIFRRIFADAPVPRLFMVGDPKQAIYSFRGGDIFTYRAAAAACENSTASLLTNHRSAAKLVEKVNDLFGGHSFPFADATVGFSRVRPETPPKQPLLFDGAGMDEPLRVTFSDSPPVSATNLSIVLGTLCADRIFELLSDPRITLPDGRRLRPSDIAVICRNSPRFRPVRERLATLGIPSVTAKAESLFDTESAHGLVKMLRAIADPADLRAVTDAMFTDYIGADPRKFAAGPSGSAAPEVDSIRRRLALLRDELSEKPFIAVFRHMAELFDLYGRVPALPGGERKLSDILQLRDIVHGFASSGARTPEAVLSRLERQLDPETRSDSDETTLMLETDRSAVRMLTVHAAKGLQFPVVLLPDLALTGVDPSKSLEYHAPDGTVRRLVPGSEAGNSALAETLQEELRIAYVALTRAVCLCEIFWGRLSRRNLLLTVPDWLFRLRGIGETPPEEVIPSALELLEKAPDPLAAIPPDWLVPAPPEPRTRWTPEEQPPLLDRECFRWKGTADADWKILSFTGISGDKPFRSAELPRDEELPNAFRLPAGAGPGIVFHEILRTIDFTDVSNLRRTVERAMRRGNLLSRDPEQRLDDACAVIENVLSAEFRTDSDEPFTLGGIPFSERASEMQFDFSLGRSFDSARTAWILNRTFREPGLEPISLRDVSANEGILTGSVDLVFRKNEKFYLIDWKTDTLEYRLENFTPGALFEAMWNERYLLQYLLYSAALIRLLAFRTGLAPREAYERYFGGVRYVFLRAVSPEHPGRGIYSDKPAFELVNEISEIETCRPGPM